MLNRPASDAVQRDDHLTLFTRLAIWPLVGLSAIFGPTLFLLPGSTARLWSWEIKPELSAVVLGAGYIFGALAFASLLLRGQWHAVNVAIFATWIFAAAMLGATLLHLDRFFTGTVRFDVWFVIYLVLPVLLPLIWFFNRRYAAPRKPGELVFIWPVRIVLLLAGLPILVFGLFMFVYPPGAAAVWPWLLTPLMSRVLSGWVMFVGLAACTIFFEPRYRAYRTALPAIIVWGAALLLGSLLHLDSFDFARPVVWLWFLALLGLIAVAALAFAIYEFVGWRRRSAGRAAAAGATPAR